MVPMSRIGYLPSILEHAKNQGFLDAQKIYLIFLGPKNKGL